MARSNPKHATQYWKKCDCVKFTKLLCVVNATDKTLVVYDEKRKTDGVKVQYRINKIKIQLYT